LSVGGLIANRYRLMRHIGEGGMGTVWEAQHEVTGARVALKFLAAAASRQSKLRKRFLSEARATYLVDHPNVVSIHDLFELDDATLVMVLDLLEGQTLSALLEQEEMLSLERTIELLLPVVGAVRTAHAHGIVHRDLNPNNILLAQRDDAADEDDAVPGDEVPGDEVPGDEVQPMVLDFGLAKLLARDNDGPPVTHTGMALGTPGYTAPEQGFGEPDVDFSADTWSLGAVLYRCLTGGVVIEGGNMGQYIKNLATEPIAPIAELDPDLPQRLCQLIDAMLHRHRDRRPDLATVERVLATPLDELEQLPTQAEQQDQHRPHDEPTAPPSFGSDNDDNGRVQDSASVGNASVGNASVGNASVGTASVGTASVGNASVGTSVDEGNQDTNDEKARAPKPATSHKWLGALAAAIVGLGAAAMIATRDDGNPSSTPAGTTTTTASAPRPGPSAIPTARASAMPSATTSAPQTTAATSARATAHATSSSRSSLPPRALPIRRGTAPTKPPATRPTAAATARASAKPRTPAGLETRDYL